MKGRADAVCVASKCCTSFGSSTLLPPSSTAASILFDNKVMCIFPLIINTIRRGVTAHCLMVRTQCYVDINSYLCKDFIKRRINKVTRGEDIFQRRQKFGSISGIDVRNAKLR